MISTFIGEDRRVVSVEFLEAGLLTDSIVCERKSDNWLNITLQRDLGHLDWPVVADH